MPAFAAIEQDAPSDILSRFDRNFPGGDDYKSSTDFRADRNSYGDGSVATFDDNISFDELDDADGSTLSTDSTAAANGGPIGDTYQYDDPGTAGTGEYEVSQGECLASIAFNTGFTPETLWNDIGNRELRDARKDPNVLLPGDRVHVPELRERIEHCVTEKRHIFVRKATRCPFRMTIMDYDRPRANECYRLKIEGLWYEGALDKDGTLNEMIPANASTGQLYLGEGPLEEMFELQFGAIDPCVNVPGIQKRLRNLGFDCGSETRLGPKTRTALSEFQRKYNLKVTGKLDDDTRNQLQEEHFSE